ncbi:MAG: hypothetical protein U1E23_07180 [Reyranellaceae bacterium]
MHTVADFDFVVGTELVEFDHRGRPIYDIGSGELAGAAGPTWGAPLDRLFGERDGLHVETGLGTAAQEIGAGPSDPLVELGNLADSLGFGVMEVAAVALDPGPDPHAGLSLNETGAWDGSGLDWTLDSHA